MRHLAQGLFFTIAMVSTLLFCLTIVFWIRDWNDTEIFKYVIQNHAQQHTNTFFVEFDSSGEVGFMAGGQTQPKFHNRPKPSTHPSIVSSGWRHFRQWDTGPSMFAQVPIPWTIDMGRLRIGRYENPGTLRPVWPMWTDIVSFPCWAVALTFAVLPAIYIFQRQRRRIPPGHCRRCGYDLRATAARCPECGTINSAAIDQPIR